MLARSAEQIPESSDATQWLYEPKWDGFRALIFFQDDGAIDIQSRNSQPLARYFPELIEPLQAALPAPCVVDGEIVIATGHGLDFDSLQLRLHPAVSRVAKLAAATPATFVAFDVLATDGDDLRRMPLSQRRERLRALLRPSDRVVLTPQTRDQEEATRWFGQYEGAGLDGLVAKPANSVYEPGVRGWTKIKHLRSVDVVVGGFRVESKGDGVASLLLGLYDPAGVLHHVGHTSSFSAAERRNLRAQLAPLEGGTSFGEGRTPGAPSRWTKARDNAWTAVRPELVCEVSFDHLQGDRFRHASRFLRWRSDKSAGDCRFDQLERPADFDLGAIVTVLGA